MRTKNHRSRKHHSRKRKQHRSRMIRRKSRAYGRRKMFGGAWIKIDGSQVDARDVRRVDEILLQYRAGDASQFSIGIEHKCREVNDPPNTVVLELPSRRVIKFDWTPDPRTHTNILRNVKYIGNQNIYELVEILPSQEPKSNASGNPVDSNGRPM